MRQGIHSEWWNVFCGSSGIGRDCSLLSHINEGYHLSESLVDHTNCVFGGPSCVSWAVIDVARLSATVRAEHGLIRAPLISDVLDYSHREKGAWQAL